MTDNNHVYLFLFFCRQGQTSSTIIILLGQQKRNLRLLFVKQYISMNHYWLIDISLDYKNPNFLVLIKKSVLKMTFNLWEHYFV